MNRGALRSSVGRARAIRRLALGSMLIVTASYVGAVLRVQVTQEAIAGLTTRLVALGTLVLAARWALACQRGAVRSQAHRCRVVVRTSGGHGRLVRLSVGRHVVGTDPNADVRLSGLAPRHAVLEVEPSGAVRALPVAARGEWQFLAPGRPIALDNLVVERCRD